MAKHPRQLNLSLQPAPSWNNHKVLYQPSAHTFIVDKSIDQTATATQEQQTVCHLLKQGNTLISRLLEVCLLSKIGRVLLSELDRTKNVFSQKGLTRSPRKNDNNKLYKGCLSRVPVKRKLTIVP